MSKVKTDNLEVYTSGSSLSILSPVAVSAGQQATMNGPFTSNNAAVFNGSGNSVTVDSGNVLAKANLYVGPSSSSPGCTLAASGAATVGTLTAGASTFNGQMDLNSNSIVDVNAITCSSLTVGGTAPMTTNPVHAIAQMTVASITANASLTGGRGFANSFSASSVTGFYLMTLTLSTALPNSSNASVVATAQTAADISVAAQITSATQIVIKWPQSANTLAINVAVFI